MCKRIHIVGSSPRTGTTLMTELLINGFEIDGFAKHEMPIFRLPNKQFNIFCSKRPRDILSAHLLLKLDPNLWIIHMVRDPRDVIVSRHGKDQSKYWTNLRIWKYYRRAAAKAKYHKRFFTVRYEDLVREPNQIQDWLMSQIPFLRKKTNFSDYHQVAQPSARSVAALKKLRPISTAGIGSWRSHKARLAAQLSLHGPIDKDLIELGYEEDSSWIHELDGVIPNNEISFYPEHLSRFKKMKRIMRQYLWIAQYALRIINSTSKSIR